MMDYNLGKLQLTPAVEAQLREFFQKAECFVEDRIRHEYAQAFMPDFSNPPAVDLTVISSRYLYEIAKLREYHRRAILSLVDLGGELVSKPPNRLEGFSPTYNVEYWVSYSPEYGTVNVCRDRR